MAKVTIQTTINAPIKDVWSSWNAFGDIYKFNPNVDRSKLLDNSKMTGLGAKRRCDLADGKSYVNEVITSYEPERFLAVDIYDGNIPLKKAEVSFLFEAISPSQTRIETTMEFLPKFGLLGAMMIPLMKGQLKKALRGMMTGNQNFVEKGVLAT
jgi:hypothetical protein